ncbi:MAG: hypothetical protein VB049_02500 [Candidatus Pelethousia sp.]|nr:hypothetical protein [Candidatus Pelethousia sp.]
MATRKQNQPAQEKAELVPGSKVILFMNGKRMEQQVLEKRRDQIVLSPITNSREETPSGSSACLVQEMADQRMFFVMLRHEERKGRGAVRLDCFRLVPGTNLYIWPELHKLAMYTWSPLHVFAPYRPDQTLLEDQALLFALSETEVSIMVDRHLPMGAFADCMLPLDEGMLVARAILTRCEDLDGGAGYRAHFFLIDQTLRPKLRDFLLNERVRRLQAVGAL